METSTGKDKSTIDSKIPVSVLTAARFLLVTLMANCSALTQMATAAEALQYFGLMTATDVFQPHRWYIMGVSIMQRKNGLAV